MHSLVHYSNLCRTIHRHLPPACLPALIVLPCHCDHQFVALPRIPATRSPLLPTSLSPSSTDLLHPTMPATAVTERQEEDRQLFDLDKHRSQSRQQLLSCRGQLAMKQKAKRRAELCMAEIQPLPESTHTYKAVGRMSAATTQSTKHGDSERGRERHRQTDGRTSADSSETG